MSSLSLLKPKKLNPGDKIAAISLSWGGPGAFPYRYEVGKERLQELFGLEVVPTKHALKPADWIYNNPKARADDLMEAFSDPSIKGIISTIGGDDSIRIVPYIDQKVITDNPKVFMGFSDTTISHFICLHSGISSFYGPSIMTGFAENVSMHKYTIESIKKSLFTSAVIGEINNNNEGWTNEYLDWANPKNQNIKRKLNSPVEKKFIGDTNNSVTGKLIGGCLECLQFINGTDLWPNADLWKESILFIETSEEGMKPDFVTRFFRNLALQGILGKISGILFSKPGGNDLCALKLDEYDNAILKVFHEFNINLIPIVTQMDFGHSAPMGVLPYGVNTKIDPVNKKVTILEPAVMD